MCKNVKSLKLFTIRNLGKNEFVFGANIICTFWKPKIFLNLMIYFITLPLTIFLLQAA